MDNITDLTINPLDSSPFVKPLRLTYKQDHKEKVWDIINAHEAVYVVIYNKTREKLIFVKQFRPAVYFTRLMEATNHPGDIEPGTKLDTSLVHPSKGVTLELCAGILDKPLTPKEIVKEEIEEECGYRVSLDAIEPITSCFSSAGTGGEVFHGFYVEVTDDMRCDQLEEMIDVEELSIQEVRDLFKQDFINTDVVSLFGLQWFLLNKASLK